MSTDNSTTAGRVYVKGRSVGKYTCDRVSITVTLYCDSHSASKASETMMAQCETFLMRLEEFGIDISLVHLDKDNVEHSTHRDKDRITASRKLKFDSEANATLNNLLIRIIQDEHLDADVSTNFYLSNENELRKGLREAAIADSKENAELLARATGKTIVGVYTIDMPHHHSRALSTKSLTVNDDVDELFCVYSRKLSMPIRDLEETVEVTWLLG